MDVARKAIVSMLILGSSGLLSCGDDGLETNLTPLGQIVYGNDSEGIFPQNGFFIDYGCESGLCNVDLILKEFTETFKVYIELFSENAEGFAGGTFQKGENGSMGNYWRHDNLTIITRNIRVIYPVSGEVFIDFLQSGHLRVEFDYVLENDISLSGFYEGPYYPLLKQWPQPSQKKSF